MCVNFTYYFYCDHDDECGFTKTVHQYDDEVVLQCEKCRHIDAKTTAQVYHLECVACGKKQTLTGDVSFDPRYQERCSSCGLCGEIGFEKGENILLILGSELKATTPCNQCKQDEWVELVDTNFTCPFCLKELKQKMSMVWDEKKDE